MEIITYTPKDLIKERLMYVPKNLVLISHNDDKFITSTEIWLKNRKFNVSFKLYAQPVENEDKMQFRLDTNVYVMKMMEFFFMGGDFDELFRSFTKEEEQEFYWNELELVKCILDFGMVPQPGISLQRAIRITIDSYSIGLVKVLLNHRQKIIQTNMFHYLYEICSCDMRKFAEMVIGYGLEPSNFDALTDFISRLHGSYKIIIKPKEKNNTTYKGLEG